ncbi:hypothetical protein [Butyricicoccus pullicaecorum]|uniref:hypothetical protein n=1 Tax=Butyricicoccus pullicaecorum TaxID=501571 RepID=UPI00399044D0
MLMKSNEKDKTGLLKQIDYLLKELENPHITVERVQSIKGLSVDLAEAIDKSFNNAAILGSFVKESYRVDSRYDKRKVKRVLKSLRVYLGDC